MFITLIEIFNILLMIFFAGFIFSDYFEPQADPNNLIAHYKRKTIWQRIGFAAMIAAPPLVFHELSHKLVAMAFGVEASLGVPYTMYGIVAILKLVGSPLLFFVGGFVSHQPLPYIQSAMVAVAGPGMNLLMWFVSYILVKYKIARKKQLRIIIPLGRMSLFLAIFNMIPIPGFDGFNFFYSLFKAFT